MRFRRFVPAFVALAVVGVLAAVAHSALTASIRVTFTAEQTSDLDLGDARLPINFTRFADFANGTGADQSNVLFTDRRTLGASSSENLDLAGSLTDGFGATATFAEVTMLAVCADDGNTNNVLVGGAASNTFTIALDNSDINVVRPGGCLVTWASDGTAYQVTAGTGDQLKIANSAGTTSVIYDVVIAGRSS